MEALLQHIIALGANRVEAMFQRYGQMGATQGQMPGREEGRRNSEDEQEQDKASQQLALSASSGCNEGTPVGSLEPDFPSVRGALGECGGAGKSGTAKRVMQTCVQKTLRRVFGSKSVEMSML